MKKLIWLFPLFLAACGGGGSSGHSPGNPPTPEPRPHESEAACEEIKVMARMYSGTPTKFYVDTLILAMEILTPRCSPGGAAEILDKNLIIKCSDICVVKEK